MTGFGRAAARAGRNAVGIFPRNGANAFSLRRRIDRAPRKPFLTLRHTQFRVFGALDEQRGGR
jgi:hypothetical protein